MDISREELRERFREFSDEELLRHFQSETPTRKLATRLESNGIFAHVWGEHLGVANIILSRAGGGSRVQVRSDQVAQAKEVIAAFERGELEIPDSLEATIDDEAPSKED